MPKETYTPLTLQEKYVLAEALDGAILDPDPGECLEAQVQDAIVSDGLDIKHGADGLALLDKLRQMGPQGRAALVRSIGRIWAQVGESSGYAFRRALEALRA